MNRRVLAAISVLMAILLPGVISTAGAPADTCNKTDFAGEGNHAVAGCGDTAAALGNYIFWRKAYRLAGQRLWCAEALATEFLNRWNSGCNETAFPLDTGGFSLVDFGTAKPRIEVLEGGSVPITFEGTSGAGLLETLSGTKVNCTSSAVKGTIEIPTEGTLEEVLKGCASSGFKCKTAGAAEGELKLPGSFRFVFDSLSPLGAALLVSPTETSFECSVFAKVKLKGSLLLLIKPLEEQKTSFELVVSESKGDPSDNKYWEGEVEKHPSLLVSVNGGAFEGSALELKEAKITTAQSFKVEG